MRAVLISLVMLATSVLYADSEPVEVPLTNEVFLVWTNKTDATDALKHINKKMGYPKHESFINNVLATNVPMTTNFCPVLKCEVKDGKTVYVLPKCDDKFWKDLPDAKKPKKDKVKKYLKD